MAVVSCPLLSKSRASPGKWEQSADFQGAERRAGRTYFEKRAHNWWNFPLPVILSGA